MLATLHSNAHKFKITKTIVCMLTYKPFSLRILRIDSWRLQAIRKKIKDVYPPTYKSISLLLNDQHQQKGTLADRQILVKLVIVKTGSKMKKVAIALSKGQIEW